MHEVERKSGSTSICTGPALDAVVELITVDGTVIASSYDNDTLDGLALPLVKDAWRGGDFYTVNPQDPGMRVILPGDPAQEQAYYVRVRSQGAADQEPDLDGGRSSGAYQLQLRLQQVDEIPGSIIRNAEILYATNGIEVIGMPGHSPLAGESAESTARRMRFSAAPTAGQFAHHRSQRD